MTFEKLWHLSTDVKADILVVNKEMAALSPKKGWSSSASDRMLPETSVQKIKC